MPEHIAAAFNHAAIDDSVHVIVLTGAGRGFCSGYDLKSFAEKPGTNPGIQEMPWDAMIDYNFMDRCTQNFMTIQRCSKPVIAKINRDAVAGGSDIARKDCISNNVLKQLASNRLLSRETLVNQFGEAGSEHRQKKPANIQ